MAPEISHIALNPPLKPGEITLSVLVPLHNDEQTLPPLVEILDRALEQYGDSAEYLLIDDGSSDGTAAMLERIAPQHPKMVGVILTKNFGQHGAITAGMDYARGRWVLLTDSDEATSADQLKLMFGAIHDDVRIVNGRLQRRTHTVWRRFTSSVAERFLMWNFKGAIPTYLYTTLLMERTVIDLVRKLPERRRNVHALTAWTGFPSVTVNLSHISQLKRQSHYRYAQLLRLFMECITGFTYDALFLPLRVAKWMMILAMAFGMVFLIPDLPVIDTILPRATFVLNIVLAATLMIFIGVLGAYIARLTSQTRLRPQYIVRKVFGMNAPDGPQP